MAFYDRSKAAATLLAGALVFGVVIGCASPGPPRAPSLQIPAPTKDLVATRRANMVELRFSLPGSTTDNLPLRAASVYVSVCRAIGNGPCRPLSAAGAQHFPLPGEGQVNDVLTPELVTGAHHLLTYRVRLSNDRGTEGEYSGPAFSVAGTAPLPISNLQAQGSRLGVLLKWQPEAGDNGKIILHREALHPLSTKQPATHRSGLTTSKKVRASESSHRSEATVLLDGGGPEKTLDISAEALEPYRYTAERIEHVQISGHDLELHSSLSAPVVFTLQDTFPPPAPTDLSVAAYLAADQPNNNERYSVDLIWQPVDDQNVVGYNVYRQALSESPTAAVEQETRLNKAPILPPAFHDSTADANLAYRYRVTSVDQKGNESAAAIATLLSQQH